METLKDKIKELEREEILKALRECDWVMAKAARRLGITDRMIGYKITKYGIRTKEVRWIDSDTREVTKSEAATEICDTQGTQLYPATISALKGENG